jgi:hypothetical protein
MNHNINSHCYLFILDIPVTKVKSETFVRPLIEIEKGG